MCLLCGSLPSLFDYSFTPDLQTTKFCSPAQTRNAITLLPGQLDTAPTENFYILQVLHHLFPLASTLTRILSSFVRAFSAMQFLLHFPLGIPTASGSTPAKPTYPPHSNSQTLLEKRIHCYYCQKKTVNCPKLSTPRFRYLATSFSMGLRCKVKYRYAFMGGIHVRALRWWSSYLFDGDGTIHAVTMGTGNQASYTYRYTRTNDPWISTNFVLRRPRPRPKL